MPIIIRIADIITMLPRNTMTAIRLSSRRTRRLLSSSAIGGGAPSSSAAGSTTCAGTTSSASAGIAASASNPFAALWRMYSSSLQRRPLPTKMAAAVFIFTASDLATQYITREDDVHVSSAKGTKRRRPGDDQSVNDTPLTAPSPFEFNAQRALSASSFGVVGTIYLHYWWNFLERFVNSRFPLAQAKSSSRITNTMVKVLIDQSVSAPLYNWCYFFITNAVHSNSQSNTNVGDRVGSAASKATDIIGPLMLQHWKIWPAIHSLNFYFTPVHNRVLVQNLVLVGWSGYLSHLNHSREVEEKEQEVLEIVDEELLQEEKEAEMMTKVIHNRRPLRLKRRKTVITGIDVAEVEVEDDELE